MRAREERAHAREDRRGGLGGQLLVDDRLRKHGEDARRLLELHAEGADRVDEPRECRVGRAQVLDRHARIEAERAVAIEELGLPADVRAFDREEPELRRDAAVGGEAAGLAAGGEHAMARHHDGEWVSPERLAHGAGQAPRAEVRRDVAVRERRARRNGPRHLVDAAVERQHALHVERDCREIARLTAEERRDAVDRALHVGWRRGFAGTRKSLEHARARLGLTRLRELHADDAASTPRDAASANRRIEEHEPVGRHDGRDHSTRRERPTWRILLSFDSGDGRTLATGAGLHVVALNWRDLRNPLAGGAEVHLEEILHHLGRRGHRCTLISSRFPGAPAVEEADGYRVIRGGGANTFNLAVPFLFRRLAAHGIVPDGSLQFLQVA